MGMTEAQIKATVESGRIVCCGDSDHRVVKTEGVGSGYTIRHTAAIETGGDADMDLMSPDELSLSAPESDFLTYPGP